MLVVAIFRALIYGSLRYFFQLQSWFSKEFYLNIKVEELILRLVFFGGCSAILVIEFFWPEVKG